MEVGTRALDKTAAQSFPSHATGSTFLTVSENCTMKHLHLVLHRRTPLTATLPQWTHLHCMLLSKSWIPAKHTPACHNQKHSSIYARQTNYPFNANKKLCVMVHCKVINITNHMICSEPYTDSHLYICHLLQDTRNKASSTAKTF